MINLFECIPMILPKCIHMILPKCMYADGFS